MEESYSSPNQKAWIITPIKELTQPLKNVECKKMLNFHLEPKDYINIESQSLSNYILFKTFLSIIECLQILNNTFYFRNC